MFLAVLVALLVLVVTWRWTTAEGLALTAVGGRVTTRFSSPGGRVLLAVAGVGLASILASSPGLSVSVPLTATLYCYG